MAIKLGREGVRLALFDRAFSDEVRADLLAAIGPGSDSRVSFHTFDISDGPAVQSAITQAVAETGAPDLAVNAAGINLTGTHDTQTETDFRRVIDVNLMGSHHFARHVLAHMSAGAHLVFIASLAGKVGNYAYAAYGSSKFGVVGLAEVLRIELIERGIDVSTVCPAEVETPMVFTERETMHPISRKLKAFAGVMEAEPAVELILHGIRRRKPLVLPGWRAKITDTLPRYFPGLSRVVVRKMVRDALREEGRRAD